MQQQQQGEAAGASSRCMQCCLHLCSVLQEMRIYIHNSSTFTCIAVVPAGLLAQALLFHHAHAQFARQVLDAGLYDTTDRPFNSTEAAAAAAASGATTAGAAQPKFWQPGVKLPSCPATKVLLTDQGIPTNYADLSPIEQTTHPTIANIIQLAYASWVDDVQQQLGGCLAGLGVDAGSIQAINVKVQPYGGTMSALVMRAGSKGVFVAFRVRHHTGDRWSIQANTVCCLLAAAMIL
jgi:hypothetical protein